MKQSISINNKPQVGVGLIIKQNGKIILGKRHNEPMSDSWQLPGGWLHLGESPEQAVQRIVAEFQHLKVGDSQFITFTNNVFDSNTHTLSLYFMLDCIQQGQQQLITSDNSPDWFWADWNNLPRPLFLPLQLLKQTGLNPFKEHE